MSLNVSINSNTFSMMKDDFDRVLTKTISNMMSKDAGESEVVLKLKVKLHNVDIPRIDEDPLRVTVPEFKHEVQSSMRITVNAKGQDIYEQFQLSWDEENGTYSLTEVDDGQFSLFASQNDSDNKEPNEDDNGAQNGNLSPKAEDLAAFEYLKRFIGEQMFVVETNGHYAVRSKDNKVILVSTGDKSYKFYCPEEILKPHVGNECICVGYGDGDDLFNVSIECDDCGTVLFELDNPKEAAE